MPFVVGAGAGALIAGAAVVGGAAVKIHQANKAASAQRYAIDKANNGLSDEAEQARDDYAPYRDLGTAAVNNLNGLMKNPGSITSDPGYQFGLTQGQTAIDRSAAGTGSLYSGATLKALQRYGQDYAGTKLNDTYNRYGNIANLGLSAVNGTTNSGQNAANNIANNTIGAGNVTAAQANANGTTIGNGINQLAAMYGGGGGNGIGLSSLAGTTQGSNQSSYNLNGGGRGGFNVPSWGG